MSQRQLAVENLTKTFGAVTAVDDVTLSFEAGLSHGVIGPNGSGKTTLFDLITGFQTPDSGTVEFAGRDVTGDGPDRLARRGLVRTFQIVSPFEGLTVRENLHSVYTDGLGASGLTVSEETADRAERVLEDLDLTAVADHEASDISGGQAKLLELGRVLMLDPDCLLLDEPTAGVNPATQRRVLDALRAVNDRGTTLIIIEHDMRVIDEVADRITVLSGGRVLTRGSFSEVVADEQVRDAYIGRVDPGPDGPLEHGANTEPTGGEAQPGDTGAGSGRGRGAGAAEPAAGRGTGPAARGGDDGSRPARAPSSRDSPTEGEALAATLASNGSGDRLVAREIVAGYGSHVVLDGVTVRSRDGVTCVFGPNGSGKSTLLKAIGGVVPVRSGTVEYGDRTLTGARPHEVVEAGITTVPQTDRVFPSLSVRENLLLGASTVDDRAVVGERLDAVLEVFPALSESFSEPASSLSGGEQVMLAVGRAAMTGADVYLLDEPLSGLAPSKVEDVVDVVRSLVDLGTQVVLVEQHVRAALPLADHVYVLGQGEIQFDGPPAGLRDAEDVVDLYLGLESATAADRSN
ncbi:MAG: ATP-binding cassette domain-containing protein [Haloarculaceae archaeon]